MKSNLDPFLLLCRAEKIPDPMLEYRFALGRKFRADYAWRRGYELSRFDTGFAGVIVEQDGGIWTKGSHSSGKGILRDMEKANLANELGWCYLRFTPQQLTQPKTIAQIKRCLGL